MPNRSRGTEKKPKSPSKRCRIERILPPINTILEASRGGSSYQARIVAAPDIKAGRGVQYGDQVFSSLSGAARAITGTMVNGWKFWRIRA